MAITSNRQHARNVILILSSAVLTAMAIVGGMVYYYGPTGIYRFEQVLLEPQNLATLTFNDTNPASGRTARYTFDRMEFAYVNDESGRWARKEIDVATYASFFSMFEGQKSLGSQREDVQKLFDSRPVGVLTIRVRLINGQGVRHFQEVQFLQKGDYFRVEVHDDSPTVQWAYFKAPGVYDRMVLLFGAGL